MSESRLTLALEAGAIHIPQTGQIAVFAPRRDTDLSAFPRDRLALVQGTKPDHDAWARRGYRVDVTAPEEVAAAVVVPAPVQGLCPQSLIAQAAAGGWAGDWSMGKRRTVLRFDT